MNYLNFTDPADMHAEVDRRQHHEPGAMAYAEQFSMSLDESVTLAANAGLAGDPAIDRAIQSALSKRGDRVADGPFPVVRIYSGHPSSGSREHTREGDLPIRNAAASRYCNICMQATHLTVPFWYPCGLVVVQIDMCNMCANRYMEAGHRPQLGVERDWDL